MSVCVWLCNWYACVLLLALESLDIRILKKKKLSIRFPILEASQQNNLYGVGFPTPRPTSKQEDQGIPCFVWAITFDLPGMGAPTSSYGTASIALRIIWPHKYHHYVQVGIPWGVILGIRNFKMESGYKEEEPVLYIHTPLSPALFPVFFICSLSTQ